MTRWIVGAVVATLVVAGTSPLFIRSYLPRQMDTLRDVAILLPESNYRWRSEGYADTWIGPHGMPGVRSLPNRDDHDAWRISLWGDSQVEGVGVADHLKIFSQCDQLAEQSAMRLSVLPLARSGDDASSWLHQLPRVESEFNIDAHVMLIVDLPDFTSAAGRFQPEPLDESQQRLARLLPAFVLQTARNLLTSEDGAATQKLRFSIGPVAAVSQRPDRPGDSIEPTDLLIDAAQATRAATTKPLMILYAPPVPVIMGGRIIESDDHELELKSLVAVLSEFGIAWLDLRPAMIDAARNGKWPRGFHNGQIGVGHLNAHGNRIIAKAIVEAMSRMERED